MRGVRLCKIFGGTALVVALAITPLAALSHALPITKLQSRSLPQRAVIDRVFEQLADVLTTPSAPSTDVDHPAPTDAEKRAMFADLEEAVAFDPDDVVRASSGLPPEDQVGRTLNRLSEIVSIWQDPTWRKHPTTSLSQLTLETRPSATRTPGLCVYFEVTLRFRPVEKLQGPQTRVTATGADVDRMYYFTTPPATLQLQKASLAQRQQTQSQCPKSDMTETVGYFRALNIAEATRAAWLAEQAIVLASSDAPGFPASCYYDKTVVECRKRLAAAKPFVADVHDCNAAACDVDVWGQGVLRIKWTSDPAPRVLSFDVEGDVIIADYVRD
jgi:hypothetical protein